MNFLAGESITNDQKDGPSEQKEGRRFRIFSEELARASDSLADCRDTAGRGFADTA